MKKKTKDIKRVPNRKLRGQRKLIYIVRRSTIIWFTQAFWTDLSHTERNWLFSLPRSKSFFINRMRVMFHEDPERKTHGDTWRGQRSRTWGVVVGETPRATAFLHQVHFPTTFDAVYRCSYIRSPHLLRKSLTFPHRVCLYVSRSYDIFIISPHVMVSPIPKSFRLGKAFTQLLFCMIPVSQGKYFA